MMRKLRVVVLCNCAVAGLAGFSSLSHGQTKSNEKEPPKTETKAPPAAVETGVAEAKQPVTVVPKANDDQIGRRLERILKASQLFENPAVQVDSGIVFLTGLAKTAEDKALATTFASNTEDVVAVVNRMEVQDRPILDLSPAWQEVNRMMRSAVQSLPLLLLASVLLLLTWLVARYSVRLSGRLFRKRMKNKLVQEVAARAIGIPVVIIGLYLVLRIAGLTQMAATVVGGTGLIGLIIGIAFRDIAENFLASILVSTQRPFSMGDLIEVNGSKGFVQGVSTRGTLLMTLEGNHVHIPNSMIYKNVIRNYSANPRQRLDFTVGIQYSGSSSQAQDIIFRLLKGHEAVLNEPEPLVLIDQLAERLVMIRVYFWIDVSKNSGDKVRSSIIRLTKKSLEEVGVKLTPDITFVSMPAAPRDGAVQQDGEARGFPTVAAPPAPPKESRQQSRIAEGRMTSDKEVIEQQARESRLPEAGTNLIANGNHDSAPAAAGK
jgi:small-conductance mechanosensitive channel